MEASHKTHRPHIKVGKDEEEEEEDIRPLECTINKKNIGVNITALGRKLTIFQRHPAFLLFLLRISSWKNALCSA